MVKKYLWPLIDDNEYGPHTSTWIKSKYLLDLDALREKESLFCFAKWQILQIKDFLYLTKENLFLITSKDLFETCLNWKCQRFQDHYSNKIDSIGDMWRFDRFDLKVLIKRDPEYIKSTLHLNLSNHFLRSFCPLMWQPLE